MCSHLSSQCLQEETLGFQEEVEGLGSLAQQVLDEAHVSSRSSTQAAQLTVRYHTLLLQLTVRPAVMPSQRGTAISSSVIFSVKESHSIFHAKLSFSLASTSEGSVSKLCI